MSSASIFVLLSIPVIIYGIDLFEKKYGSAKAGWLATFPIVGGPAMLIIILEHGTAFGSIAAYNASVGMVPWVAFILCYRLSKSVPTWFIILLSIILWLVIGVALTSIRFSSYWFLLIMAFLVVISFAFGSITKEQKKQKRSLLFARIGFAVSLVLLIAYLAEISGERFSGLLITFPIVSASIMLPLFILGERDKVHRMTSGMVIAGPALASFMISLSFFLDASFTILHTFIFTLLISSSIHYLMLKLVIHFTRKDHGL